ncbi:serine aminopeptidase domain-containing protein [Cupriavidus basilensis]
MRDIQTFVDHIAAVQLASRVERIAVVAQSVGAVLASTWVHDHAPRIRCLVLCLASVQGQALRAVRRRPGLKLMHKLRGKFFVNSYVKAKFLDARPGTHCQLPARSADYASDRRQYPAGSLRDGRSHRGRCGRHHRCPRNC